MTSFSEVTGKGKIESLTGKIIKSNDEREVNTKSGETKRVCNYTIQEPETDDILTLTLWGEHIDQFQKGDSIVITNGFSNVFNGEVSVGTGLYGEIRKAE